MIKYVCNVFHHVKYNEKRQKIDDICIVFKANQATNWIFSEWILKNISNDEKLLK